MPLLDERKRFLHYFEEICKIPHGSTNEKAISDYIVDFAQKHNLKYLQDDLYNVIIYKDASKGYENKTPLMLQAHIDMVAEKNLDTEFDFLKDSLILEVEDNYLKAKGTTLGADDGAGVAYMLALLEDESLIHPALEMVFTVQEEIGLIGALNLKGEYFKSKRLINLDSGHENSTCITSSGGMRADTKIPYVLVDNDKPCYLIQVKGLDGGHSGGLINKNKGNANKLLARVLNKLKTEDTNLRLVHIHGGLKDNAIPREAEAIIATSLDFDSLEKITKQLEKDFKNEYSQSDANVVVTLKAVDKVLKSFDEKSTNNIINYEFLCINGLQAMSQAIKDLPILSLNLGVVTTDEECVNFMHSIRTPIQSAKDNIYENLQELALLCNGRTNASAQYPGWDYEENSPLRKIMHEVAGDFFDEPLKEVATHGGLECGVFKNIIPDLDIVTLGPNMDDIHTPNERLDLISFEKCYNVLKALVERCAEE